MLCSRILYHVHPFVTTFISHPKPRPLTCTTLTKANHRVSKMAAKKNVAVIFGVTGLVGKEIAISLLKTGQWKVYGVARNPEVLPFEDSNYHFISCDLLNPAQSMEKLSLLVDVTNIFWVTWASQCVSYDQESCDQNVAMMSNVLDAVLPKATSLRHFSLQTGSKHYIEINTFADNWVGDYSEDLPRVAGVHNFYYALEDLLKERFSGSIVGWAVHRPGLIIGSSKRTVFNLMGCLTVYATICKHLNLPFVFGGTRQCWEEFCIDASDARLIAEQHIWSGSSDTDISSRQGEAFNAINGTPFISKEIWPALAEKFGVEIPADNMGFSSSFSVAEFMADKGHVWEEIVSKEGLTPTKVEDLADWAWMYSLFRNPMKMLASREKANRLGFKTTYEAVDSILYWTDRMRDARLIPGDPSF